MLQKENIVLRAPEPADVDFLYALENDRQLWYVSNTLAPFSHFDLEQFILQQEKDVFVSGQSRFVIDKVNEKSRVTIGAVDLFSVEAKHRRAGIGIMLIEKERGKGRASIALELIIDYSFSVLNLHQLFCNIGADNERSLQLFESKGFEQVGIKRDWNIHKGKWQDEVLLQFINKA